jgi:phenylacetate-CoA ligase
MKAAGMKPRDRLVRLVSGQPASRVATLGRTIDIPLATSLSELLDSIAAARPNFLLGPPATLEYISLEMLERGLQLPPGLKLLLANGDNLTKAGRDLCRAAFGCEVVDHYASRECSSGIAWQCSEIDGYHVNVENVFLEVLNADGEVAAPGEVGRVVITDLSSQPVPLIRYEVGDLAAWQGRSCGCGRSLPCLASIDGRIIERMKLANGEWLTAHVLNTAFAKVPFPVQYQVREDAPGHITVDVVIPSKSDASNELNAIEAALGRTVLATVAWAVNRIDSIPGELFSKRRLFFPYEGDEARQHLRSAS